METWRQIDESVRKDIAERHQRKDFRPTAVACVRNQRGEFLVAMAKKASEYFFVQGGVNEGETLTSAVARELYEEVGQKIGFGLRILTTASVPYLPGRVTRDGFSEGKRYYVCGMTNQFGSDELVIDKEELKEAKWVDFVKLSELMDGMHPEKAGLAMIALQSLGYEFKVSDGRFQPVWKVEMDNFFAKLDCNREAAKRLFSAFGMGILPSSLTLKLLELYVRSNGPNMDDVAKAMTSEAGKYSLNDDQRELLGRFYDDYLGW